MSDGPETNRDSAEPGGEPGVDPLEALRRGDSGPFEDLVRTRTRTFFGFFRSLGASVEEAEDLTQDLFVRLHRGRARYRSRGRVLAYCLRVGRNVWIDRCRRLGVRPDRPSSEEELVLLAELDGVDPPSELSRAESGRRCRDALESLPATMRDVVRLSVLEGQSHGEVSSRLNVPVGTVKSRLFYGLRRLRELLPREVAE